MSEQEHKSAWAESDSIEKQGIPIGQYVWTINSKFGDIIPTTPDTLHHHFNNGAFTEGILGHYNTTGNLGSPRISRLFEEQMNSMFENQFIFANPYDFFITPVDKLIYTNTKSPFTNLTYHSCGNKQNGEDRIKGLFYVNVNKRLGVGFKLDYLYGRGYYANQSTAHFNGTLYGSYRGKIYEMHTQYFANHLKNAENGGVEEITYITQPELYPTKYGTADMPTRLSKTWNKMNVNTFFLNHKYKIGRTRYKDENSANDSKTKGTKFLDAVITNDETALEGALEIEGDTTIQNIPEFTHVASIIHTMKIDHNNRRFLSNIPSSIHSPHFFNDYYLPGDSANDYTKNLHIANTLGFELNEGFCKWAKAGVRLFAKHDFFKFTLPTENQTTKRYHEHYITLGAQLLRQQGKTFNYNLLGELRTSGKTWGEFNIEGNLSLKFLTKNDTLSLGLNGYIRNEEPSFYYKHYHSRNAWWDNYDLSQMFRSSICGTLKYKMTQLNIRLESIQNYTYFQSIVTPYYNKEGICLPLQSVGVQQSKRNIQLLSATLRQDFKWGIFNWENELTYQISSNKTTFPLPLLNAYSNMYLKFSISKVLHTELGADIRYFTRYKAPVYSPIIGQYCTQDNTSPIKTGNYPIINAYVNFQIQHTRFYIMASHINSSSGNGFPFLVPNYPMNRMVIRFGLSWNFFN